MLKTLNPLRLDFHFFIMIFFVFQLIKSDKLVKTTSQNKYIIDNGTSFKSVNDNEDFIKISSNDMKDKLKDGILDSEKILFQKWNLLQLKKIFFKISNLEKNNISNKEINPKKIPLIEKSK